MRSATPPRHRFRGTEINLAAPGWDPDVRQALENLIREGAGKGHAAVFDFDNTIVCGDIGEATLAVLARSGALKPDRIAPTLSPPLLLAGGRKASLEAFATVADYYQAFLAPTVHGSGDPTPTANAYVWAVEILEGLRPLDVVTATRATFELSRKGKPYFIAVPPGTSSFPAPFFYPEMVELIGQLLRNQFDFWVVSASNVWSVRWMVLQGLNPELRRAGFKRFVRPDHVIGISTLLADGAGRLYKDPVLVRQDRAYAALDPGRLADFRLTSRLHFPVPMYSGKVACLLDTLGGRPYLGAGDSLADHPMLACSRHRLWIARLEKPDYQRRTAALMRQTGRASWMVQPTLTRQAPGFVPDLRQVPKLVKALPPEVRRAMRVIRRLGAPAPAAAPGHLPAPSKRPRACSANGELDPPLCFPLRSP